MGANHSVRRVRRGSNLLLCEAAKTDAGSWKVIITYGSGAKIAGLN